ncbi:hypothetical protein FKM82_030541 [Ascaphus truei]
MDKWLKKTQTNNVPVTNSSTSTDKQSSDVQPGTSSESGTNRQSSDEQPGTSSNSGSNKRPHDVQSTTFAKKKKEPWTRQYSEDYIQFGFIKGADEKPLCVICFSALSNESMKPSKLKRHLELKHPEYSNKPIDFFINKKRELIVTKKTMSLNFSQGPQSENLAMASYEISHLIAETGYPHTIAEKLIVPAMKVLASRICDKKQEKQVNMLALSNNTVKRRIVEMADNIEETVVSHLKECRFFSLQVDESTDISDKANLMCFVRYDFANTTREEFLFCKPLTTRTTAEEIFNLIDNYINQNGIEWKKCVGLSSDGARAMAGARTRLFPRIKAVAPDCVWVHCSIHREALAVKKMPLLLTATMQQCVRFINYIKSRPLHSRIFSALCKEMGSEHEHLLLHCEVRWLSRGNVLKRLSEMKEEVLMFLDQHPPTAKDVIFEFKDSFHDVNWVIKLTELQKEYNMSSMPDEISAAIKEHLLGLETSMKEYFPPINSNKAWIRNPFTVNVESNTELQDSDIDFIIELSCDTALKDIFDRIPLVDFWLSCRQEYPVLAEKAIQFLMPFVTTYKCEAGFSTLVFLKNKYRNRLEVEPDLRIKLSSFPPNLKFLVSKKQHHTSH